MIDGFALALTAPQLEAPEQVQRIKKRKNRSTATPDSRRRSSSWPWVIGAVILLDDGSACQIVALEPEPLCVPIPTSPN